MLSLRDHFQHELFVNQNSELTQFLLNRILNMRSEFVCITTFHDGEFIYANDSVVRRLGYSDEELLKLNVFDLGIWTNAVERDNVMSALEESGLIQDLEIEVRDRQNNIVTCVLNLELINILAKPCILIAGRDISIVKAIEKNKYDEMKEELLQTVRSVNGFVIQMKKREDGELYYVLAEGRIAEELGYTTANSYGKTVREIFPFLYKTEGQYYDRILQGETISFETELHGRSLYKTLIPYYNQGRVTGIIATAVDISERKNIEKMLRLSEMNAALGELAVGVAHEIRNPLTGIRGFVQLLGETLKRYGIEKEQRYVDLIQTELSRINDLVSEMLWLRKPKESSMETIDMLKLVNDILPLIQVDTNMNNIQMDTDGVVAGRSIIANVALLKQVILNLCKNSIEAMESGGRLVLGLREADHTVTLFVQDSGPGIPPDVMDKLFTPFFTTKQSGNGLGLFISKQIIVEMGGELTIETSSKGTVVSVTFPVEMDNDQDEEKSI
ncbi:PAS domain-containing sensor histidine kinase [Paenibacillus sp. ATY16]|uniref:PAS domain-containing sensor histidine kinase n=1 Tax=Paenibacillus sp. ATY16 TaxID=1759312 RepID=UPI002010C5CA|nr:PAS domain-containing sensor histidine kinase [Paenibacillus sp. ATY16]MCK9860048.1 ATP-binding protein [Paenibacillus sp. ATY16]